MLAARSAYCQDMFHRELLIDGHFVGGPCDQAVLKEVVRSPYSDLIVGTVAEGSWSEMNACLEAATEAFGSWRQQTRHARQALLRKISSAVRDRSEEMARILVDEIGKPIVWARAEVARLALTFDDAADALSTFGVEAIPVDLDPRGHGYRGLVERFPIGPVFCIVPYNWPYNLAAHKIAPALAVGNTVVLKPSEKASLSTLTLARLIHEAGCPPGVLNAWNGPIPIVARAVQDPRVKMLSFTGSPKVGWMLKERLPRKRVTLELGGNASAIVHRDADLEWAVSRIIPGAFGYAGQICISVQHVWVHESVYEEVRERLVEGTRACPYGDPSLEETVCGPLITEEAAVNIETLVQDAVSSGARVLVGGTRQGAMMPPTLVESVPAQVALSCEEAFGPVLTLAPYRDLDSVVETLNRGRYGIHAAIFTRSMAVAEKAFREIETGGVIVNDSPTLRFDNLPYGGVRESGFGREGVRYAMEEMTEPKVRIERLV